MRQSDISQFFSHPKVNTAFITLLKRKKAKLFCKDAFFELIMNIFFFDSDMFFTTNVYCDDSHACEEQL